MFMLCQLVYYETASTFTVFSMNASMNIGVIQKLFNWFLQQVVTTDRYDS